MFNFLVKTAIILLLSTVSVCADQASDSINPFDQDTGVQIENLLGNRAPAAMQTHVSGRAIHDQLVTLYQKRDFLPIWFAGLDLQPEADILLENLRSAGTHGLCGMADLLRDVEGLLGIQAGIAPQNLPQTSVDRAMIDLLLSQAFLTYATQMVEGQVDPALAHVDWRSRRRKADLVKLLDYAVSNHRLQQVLDGLVPPHLGYRRLVEALRRYQEISAYGGWPAIPSGPTIRPADRDERILLVRNLLLKTGDLELAVAAKPIYDPATVAAIKVFQARHGLQVDGVIGPKTLAALNVPVEARIRQIELNLERWRWMPKSFGKRYIRVNVADFSLEVVEHGKLVMRMPVIVGTQYRKTPVFSASMTYLEFAPYWTVPPTILREDKLPQIKAKPGYLEENHFRIISRAPGDGFVDPRQIDWSNIDAAHFPGLLRMDPGPWNPLGQVKFMFPNRFNVYMHDTNQGYLFEKNIRSFSSGCIRVERPRDLVNFLLGKDLGPMQIDELFKATSPVEVPIDPIPVHIQYWTAWVDDDGRLNFRPDVYYRDLDLDVALTHPDYRVMEHLQDNPAPN